MVDVHDISSKALEDMKKDKGFFQKLGLYGGEAQLVASARTAAENKVAAAVAENANIATKELESLASDTFRKTLKAEGNALLADKGHLVASLKNMGRNGWNGGAEGFRNIFGRTKNAAGEVVAKEPGRISKAFAWLPNKIGNFAKNNPRFTFVAAGLGAVYGGARLLENRSAAKQQAEYEANMQQVAAMQAAAAQQGGARGGYYGSVTAEEAAAMDAQMRTGGQNAGFAAAEMQRRAAAVAVEQGPAA